MQKFLKRYVGDKAFYSMVLAIVVPMIIQNGITNFVSLLDNIMVGQIGTEQMSGVSLANQLMFIFNLCIFGGLGGVGIFTAQYYGSRNIKGVQETFRVKLYLAFILLAVGSTVFLTFGEPLIGLFLHEGDTTGDVALTLSSGMAYMRIMIVGLIPFAINNVYASTLRECGETKLPMVGGLAAVFVNLILNYVFIYGKLGCPAMGVQGAALATVISRFVESAIILIGAHRNHERFSWLAGVYSGFHVSGNLLRQIAIKGLPLLVNEALWSVGMSILTQCYSTRGLIAIAGLNIASTITNLFNVFYFTLGNAVAIIVGQALGAGDMERAQDHDRKLIFMSTIVSVGVGLLLACAAPLIPHMYNTSLDVRELATKFILVSALCTPLYSYCHCSYFTLRSGGKTIVTFCFDCGFLWLISIPTAFVLSRFTNLPIVPVYLLCQSIDLLKCIVAYFLLRSGIWINNIVDET